MMRFGLIIVGLAFGLGGCAGVTEPLGMEDPFAIPQPFQGMERNDEMIAQAIEVPALVVDVPQGMANEVGTALRDQVVEAARKHDIPALSQATPLAWVLNAQAATIAASDKAGGEQTVISWRLFDATGKERTQFPVTFAGTEASLTVGGVQLLAEQTASALETALTHPGRQVTTIASTAVRPIAWVGAIKGAPGDGNTALARALQGVLPLKGVKVDPKKEKAAWRVEGVVKVVRGAGDNDVVTLTWRVLDAKGKEAGTIAQENAVPRGRLSKPWAEIAGFAAEAAAEGIAQLIQQIAQPKAG
jgi:hypothetical protein